MWSPRMDMWRPPMPPLPMCLGQRVVRPRPPSWTRPTSRAPPVPGDRTQMIRITILMFDIQGMMVVPVPGAEPMMANLRDPEHPCQWGTHDAEGSVMFMDRESSKSHTLTPRAATSMRARAGRPARFPVSTV
jgi:hypothetical protein